MAPSMALGCHGLGAIFEPPPEPSKLTEMALRKHVGSRHPRRPQRQAVPDSKADWEEQANSAREEKRLRTVVNRREEGPATRRGNGREDEADGRQNPATQKRGFRLVVVGGASESMAGIRPPRMSPGTSCLWPSFRWLGCGISPFAAAVQFESLLDQFPQLAAFLPGAFSILGDQRRINSQGDLLSSDRRAGFPARWSASTGEESSCWTHLVVHRVSFGPHFGSRPLARCRWLRIRWCGDQPTEDTVDSVDWFLAHGKTLISSDKTRR